MFWIACAVIPWILILWLLCFLSDSFPDVLCSSLQHITDVRLLCFPGTFVYWLLISFKILDSLAELEERKEVKIFIFLFFFFSAPCQLSAGAASPAGCELPGDQQSLNSGGTVSHWTSSHGVIAAFCCCHALSTALSPN